jgi:hypothetical protein
MVTLYRGFNIAHDGLKQTVDDFMDSIVPFTTPDEGCKRIDAARIAIARAAACSMLVPLVIKSNQQLPILKRTNGLGFGSVAVVPTFAPNRIQRKHLTTDSRLRNLMHGGILGALARRLTLDPTQPRQWHQFNNAFCVVQRANNAAGCAHVKWSMPEFQCAFNIGIKTYKAGQSPLNALNDADRLDQFNLLDNAENRDAFLAECNAVACGANQSRVVLPMNADTSSTVVWKTHRPVVVDNPWIMRFVSGFIKVCSAKMAAVNDGNATKMDRSQNLIDMYRFLARIEWIFNDPNVRCVINLDGLYQAHIKRLIYMAEQGIEHSAYMLGRICPEMMTPELHVRVVPNPEFYMVPQLQIQPDDDVFGPMKIACQGLMPEMPEPVRVPECRRIYSDSDSDSDDDDYYNDDDNDDNDDYNDDDDNDDDNDNDDANG